MGKHKQALLNPQHQLWKGHVSKIEFDLLRRISTRNSATE